MNQCLKKHIICITFGISVFEIWLLFGYWCLGFCVLLFFASFIKLIF
jgi:hypothetical protein